MNKLKTFLKGGVIPPASNALYLFGLLTGAAAFALGYKLKDVFYASFLSTVLWTFVFIIIGLIFHRIAFWIYTKLAEPSESLKIRYTEAFISKIRAVALTDSDSRRRRIAQEILLVTELAETNPLDYTETQITNALWAYTCGTPEEKAAADLFFTVLTKEK